MKIVITGGTGRFGQVLKKIKSKHKILFPNKNKLNILNYKKISNYLKKEKPNILIHLAGLSRPMDIHDKKISQSIDLNIIGTANITKACFENKTKLIYFSTNYVYPGEKGNYKENDPIKPINNYAWSKLGGEASVKLYKNSLILRVCMTEKPFVHKSAFANAKSSFLYHDQVALILFKVLKQKGILNIGGRSQNIYDFVVKENKNIKKIFLKKNLNYGIPKNSSLNLLKLKKILKKNF